MRDHYGRPYRRSVRLPKYDYATDGAYFVTVCVQWREHLFGAISNGQLIHNAAARMIDKWWYKLPIKFPNVDIDEHVIMPDHFHGIIWIVGAAPRGRPSRDVNCGQPHGVAPTTLGDIMDWFKTMTTNAYIRAVKSDHWPPFPGRLWQRNYYERIIRNDAELHETRRYIRDNPAHWAIDPENM